MTTSENGEPPAAIGCTMTAVMHLDPTLCYRAVRSRDARFDGRFFTAVKTTGIYCRPICPARTPRRENVVFFSCAAAAEAEGFRPCRRCRPDVAPSTPAWSGTTATVARALTLIDDGALDRGSIDDLARRLGVGERHLRRLFLAHLGAPPLAVANTRRTHVARTLIEQTQLPMTEIAFAAGFGSLRRFNAAMRATYGLAPTALRNGHAADGAISIRLAYRPPFDWDGALAFLDSRVLESVERVDGDAYERLDAGVRITHDPTRHAIVLSVPTSRAKELPALARTARHLFDLGADPAGIGEHLAHDPRLAPLVRRFPGVRVAGSWNPFETAIRAIVGQQVSVAGARTVANRIAARYPLTPDALAEADIDGMPSKRAETIRAFSRAVAEKRVTLERGTALDEVVASLTSVPGIGPWTAQYIAMRALGDPDAFPSGDLALRRAAGNLTDKELLRKAEAWRPWRAYAAMLLWKS